MRNNAFAKWDNFELSFATRTPRPAAANEVFYRWNFCPINERISVCVANCIMPKFLLRFYNFLQSATLACHIANWDDINTVGAAGWDGMPKWIETDKTQGESDAGGGGGSKAAALQSCLVVWNTFPKECKNLPTLLLRVRKWSNYQWIKVIIPISRHFAKWVGGWMANGKPFRI